MTQQLPSSGGLQYTTDTSGGGTNQNPGGNQVQQAQQQSTQSDEDAKKAAAAAAARQDYLNHFQYGGQPGYAQQQSNFFNNGAQAAQNRPGEQINYGLAQGAYGQAQANAGYQGQLAQMMLARANGTMPSISQMQADRQMGQATAAQNSMQASARGPAGLALAQQQAAGNIAGVQSNISNQAQINGAQEQLQNQNAAFGAFSGIRGQDLQSMQAQADMAQKQAAINAAQRAQNDQYSMGQYGLANQINTTQLGAQGNQIAIESGATQAANNLALQSQIHSDDQTAKYLGLGLGAAGTAFGALGVLGVLGGNSQPIPGSQGVSFNDGNTDFNSGGGSAYSDDGGNNIGSSSDPPDVSDANAKTNISPLSYGMAAPTYEIPMQRSASDDRAKAEAYDKIQAQQQSQYQGLMMNGPAVGDPVTQQFATGLEPSSYEYRAGVPGATPGMKVGPIAQNMVANPVTATAVRRMPNGLLAVDGRDGLKVALGGVGHLAKRQQATDANVAGLVEAARQMQAKLDAQSAMLGNGPAVVRVAPGSAANGYNTELTAGSEPAYQRWLAKVAPGDDGRDYDYRGAYAAGQGRGGANGHFTDQYKKPNHETFSNESQYAADRPEIAGSWDGDTYQPKGPAPWLRMRMESEAQGVQPSYAQPYSAPVPVPGADPRVVEADRMMNDINAQGQGLMSQGPSVQAPSVGQQYLAYTRGN